MDAKTIVIGWEQRSIFISDVGSAGREYNVLVSVSLPKLCTALDGYGRDAMASRKSVSAL